jgi:hypothetical protein
VLGGCLLLVAYPPSTTTTTRITTVWTDDEPLADRSVWLDVALGLVVAAFVVCLALAVLP